MYKVGSMRLLLLIMVVFLTSISVSARDDFDITEVKVYKDNIMTKTPLQIAKLKSSKMGEEDMARIQALIDGIIPTTFSPVSPDPGGVFCLLKLADDSTPYIRITSNVIVMKLGTKGKESYQFYTPRDEKHIEMVRALLYRFAEE